MKMPNCLTAASSWTSSRQAPSFVVIISLIGLLDQAQVSLAHYQQAQQEPVAANEIPTAKTKQNSEASSSGPEARNFSQFSRDVTKLRLTPELRSIKLRWTYEHDEANRPESFEIRYCELTSWMAEIKCSHREIPVRARESGGAQTSTTTLEKQQYLPAAAASDDLNQPTVITKATDGRSSSPAVAERFETQIYDLRALTNYTFHVHVARFLGEPSAELANQQSRNVSAGRQLQPLTARQRPSRRLEAPGDGQEARGRVEMTKAFSAEAVKCLADSSEVLVNTGRFFGGRISVEGQQDARCQLLGNKSSEQSAYSFRIDHEACRSKITEGNRIETMILVQENRDLLTHNTARFLVQCNIGQQSFTVKASIALPKVVSGSIGQRAGSQQQQQTRPALIAPLAARPAQGWRGAPAEVNFDRVHLGSMPGIYRLLRAEGALSPQPLALVASREPTAAAATELAQNSALTNDLSGEPTTTTTASSSKVLAGPQAASSPLPTPTMAHESGQATSRPPPTVSAAATAAAARSQRRSKELTTAAEPLGLPKPVDVSSQLLFVERTEPQGVAPPMAQREARLMAEPRRSTSAANLLRKQQPAGQQQGALITNKPVPPSDRMTDKPAPTNGGRADGPPGRRLESPPIDEETSAPLIMTNNHRVAGDFASLANSGAAAPRPPSIGQAPGDAEGDFSIRYSANRVQEYSLDRLQASEAVAAQGGQSAGHVARSRSGRMRQINGQPAAGAKSGANLESRMGDAMQAPTTEAPGLSKQTTNDLLASDSSERSEKFVPAAAGGETTEGALLPNATHTLAHNITGALIRWSLKTLGNLARKSLESLVTDDHEHDEGRQMMEARITHPDQRLANSRTLLMVPTTLAPAPSGSSSPTSKRAPLRATEAAPRWTQEHPGAGGETANLEGTSLNRVDGFIVGQRASESPQTPTAKLAAKAQTHRPPPAQDTPRGKHQEQGDQARRQQAQPTLTSETARRGQKAAQDGEAPAWRKGELGANDRDSRQSMRSPWPIYCLWALCGLIALVVVAIYFVLMSPNRRNSTSTAAHGQHSDATTKPTGNLLARLNETFRKNSSQTLQTQRALSRSTIASANRSIGQSAEILTTNNRRKLFFASATTRPDDNGGGNNNVQEAPNSGASVYPTSSPIGSATTRSTSAASLNSSSIGGRENYCKDREQYVVYTDYLVLTDDNSSFADDNECLTRSGRRRRAPGESFA